MTLYDADRCPYCARVRLVLAEKGVPHDVVAVDLDDRPSWIYEKNATGRVPVLEEDAFVLPESVVICEYLEERYPEPPLLPADPAERALARLAIFRFDDRLGDDYYALRRGSEGAADRLARRLADLDAELEARPFLTGREFGLADIAYLPWVLRARERLGVSLEPFPALAGWVERCAERPSVADELELAGAR
jgi:RNA polymerase-associated protein